MKLAKRRCNHSYKSYLRPNYCLTGNDILVMRNSMGLAQDSFAHALGVNRSRLSMWELKGAEKIEARVPTQNLIKLIYADNFVSSDQEFRSIARKLWDDL